MINSKYKSLIIYIITFLISSYAGILICDLESIFEPDAPARGLIFLLIFNYIVHIVLFLLYSINIIRKNDDALLLKIYDNFKIPFIILCCMIAFDMLLVQLKVVNNDLIFYSTTFRYLIPIYFISLINATRISENKVINKLKIPIYILFGLLFLYISGLWYLFLPIIAIFIK